MNHETGQKVTIHTKSHLEKNHPKQVKKGALDALGCVVTKDMLECAGESFLIKELDEEKQTYTMHELPYLWPEWMIEGRYIKKAKYTKPTRACFIMLAADNMLNHGGDVKLFNTTDIVQSLCHTYIENGLKVGYFALAGSVSGKNTKSDYTLTGLGLCVLRSWYNAGLSKASFEWDKHSKCSGSRKGNGGDSTWVTRANNILSLEGMRIVDQTIVEAMPCAIKDHEEEAPQSDPAWNHLIGAVQLIDSLLSDMPDGPSEVLKDRLVMLCAVVNASGPTTITPYFEKKELDDMHDRLASLGYDEAKKLCAALDQSESA